MLSSVISQYENEMGFLFGKCRQALSTHVVYRRGRVDPSLAKGYTGSMNFKKRKDIYENAGLVVISVALEQSYLVVLRIHMLFPLYN